MRNDILLKESESYFRTIKMCCIEALFLMLVVIMVKYLHIMVVFVVVVQPLIYADLNK